jgi:hypothetical protein
MGFFDALNDPEQSSRLAAALKIMELSGPSRTPTNLGQILAGGLGSYLNTKQDHQDRAAQQEQLKQMQAMRALQMRKLQGDFDAEQAQQAQAGQLGNAYKDFYSQGQHISNPMAAITGPTLDQLPKLEQVNQEPKRPLSPFDREMKLAEFLRGQGMFMDAIKHEKQAHEVRGKGEWKNVIKDGKVLSAPFFQDGTRGDISDLAPAYDKQIKDFGGFFGVMDPILGGVLEKYAKTQSPDSKARLAFDREKLNFDRTMENGGLGKAPPGYRWTPQGTLSAIPGGPADKHAAATEGERKAGTLLQRLNGSLAQLDAAVAEDKSAEKPGVIASGLRQGGMEMLANSITPQARQRVEAAQLDALDAALTLATGAAYTREQLEGHRRSYFPQIGDDAKTIADKTARRENLMRSARIAAGRAATQQGGASGDWSIEKVN